MPANNALHKNDVHAFFPSLGNLKNAVLGFPGGPVVKNWSANAGDMGSITGLGRSHTPWGN